MNKQVFTGNWFVFVRLLFHFCVSIQSVWHPLLLQRRTVHLCVIPLSRVLSFCPPLLMCRWSWWSCSSASQPAWWGGCTESATGSPHGWRQYRKVTSSQRRTSQNLSRVWCSPCYWPCSARQAVSMQPRPCRTWLWWGPSWSSPLCWRSKSALNQRKNHISQKFCFWRIWSTVASFPL